ncbi:unknown protein [Simkania negevensis Z]|uniref:Uncharacterized protein n=1 Tax=Simkania negevensis (strain ATCC VR-1471 / DSM 27360 / Z) TaxID=331113 RepID=F8L3R3_SIMNZ|nr:unknown protein [Simkania negevensis Z]
MLIWIFVFFSDSQSQTFHILDEKEGKVRLCASEEKKNFRWRFIGCYLSY